MKFIDSGFEIIEQKDGLDGLYKHVERAARVSYKSEDKITEDSAAIMVKRLMESNHGAALEHGTVYLKFPYLTEHCKGTPMYFSRRRLMSETYYGNPYSWVSGVQSDGILYVTTNLRVLFENDVLEDLKYLCEPTEFHKRRYTVKFTTSIGISREFIRHRTMSFLNESTRYVNYSKGKFGSELTYIIPRWIYDIQAEKASYKDYTTGESQDWLMNLKGEDLVNQLSCMDRTVSSYVDLLEHIERDYMFYLGTNESYKLKPQEARGILPMDTKSELIMTGFASDWIHFFNLRSYIAMTGKPHPDAQYLTDNLLQEFLDRNYIQYEQLYKRDKVEVSGSKETS